MKRGIHPDYRPVAFRADTAGRVELLDQRRGRT
jgi:ribosomal protein L31